MNYLSFEEFVEKYGLKNEVTSNVKIKEVLDKLTIPARVYMRDDKFTTDSGIVNLHPTKEHTELCLLLSFILSHMAVHLQLIGYGTICRKTICRKLTQGQFAEFFSANCP